MNSWNILALKCSQDDIFGLMVELNLFPMPMLGLSKASFSISFD